MGAVGHSPLGGAELFDELDSELHPAVMKEVRRAAKKRLGSANGIWHLLIEGEEEARPIPIMVMIPVIECELSQQK